MTEPTTDDVKVDIALIKGDDGIYDAVIGDDGDFVPVYGFQTSILMDVLCEARADAGEIAIEAKRRGWIGNETPAVPGFEIGSKLWLQYQARQDTITKNAAVDAVEEALQWYVPRFATDIQVEGLNTAKGLQIAVTVVRKSGKIDKLYFRLWELTGS